MPRFFSLGLAAEDEVCERDEGVALLRCRQPGDSVDSTLRMEESERPRSIYPVRLHHIPPRQYLYFCTVPRGLFVRLGECVCAIKRDSSSIEANE